MHSHTRHQHYDFHSCPSHEVACLRTDSWDLATETFPYDSVSYQVVVLETLETLLALLEMLVLEEMLALLVMPVPL